MLKAASAVSVLVFIAAVSGARGQPAVDPKAVTPDTAKIEAKDCPETSEDCKIICKKFPPKTGSLLGGHSECRTKHFWDDRMRQDQGALVKLQLDATHLAIVY